MEATPMTSCLAHCRKSETKSVCTDRKQLSKNPNGHRSPSSNSAKVAHLTKKIGCASLKGWRRQWHPTPALLPGKSHGWKSLEGCSPWGR